MNGEDPFLDEGLRPDFRQEFVLRDQMTWVPHQRDENVEGFRREPDDRGAAQQLALAYVECAIGEMKGLSARHGISANLSKTFGTTLPASVHRSTSWTAPRASSIRPSGVSTPAPTAGDSSGEEIERLTFRRGPLSRPRLCPSR